tara:strand:+ start:3246 stop:4139 length:894 start_codon:yes stop_codon:yes gene_type:complete
MSLNLDDVVIGGQLKVGVGICPPINEGDKRINGSMLCEGPVVLGGSTEFPNNRATLMVGRTKNDDPDCTPATHSLYVKGDSVLEGDATNSAALFIDSGNPNAIQIKSGGGKAIDINNGTAWIDDSGEAYFRVGSATKTLSDRFATADRLGKAFDMPHPTKGKGHRLSHACIEGPEIGVYYRGRVRNEKVIMLPPYWKGLVHEDSISVQLQPIGAHQDIIVKRWDDEKIYLQSKGGMPIDCFYHICAERKDVNPLHVEYEGETCFDYPDPNHLNKNPDDPERDLLDSQYRGPRNTITK